MAAGYIALVHKDQGTSYGVSFPDVPGCISAGDTFEEAVANAADALAFHFEGMKADGDAIPALPVIWSFFEGLDKPPHEGVSPATPGSHPRYFPGEVRQMALEQFEKKGRMCGGVDKLKKAHKLNERALIEFDHILPHSKGGPSTYRNIQILCVDCNRLKRDTAS